MPLDGHVVGCLSGDGGAASLRQAEAFEVERERNQQHLRRVTGVDEIADVLSTLIHFIAAGGYRIGANVREQLV